jgi:hypothetical protein
MPFFSEDSNGADNAPGGTHLLWSSNLFGEVNRHVTTSGPQRGRWCTVSAMLKVTSEAEGSRVSARLSLVVSSTLPSMKGAK